jgi:flagellar hook protein FlgE
LEFSRVSATFPQIFRPGRALELSNVDIATEFANLIQAQRAFEANARTVTTFDQITQDTINLKQ